MLEVQPTFKQRLLVLTLGCCLCVMLVCLLKTRLVNPSLTVQVNNLPQAMQDSMPPMGQANSISSLMQALGQNPHDLPKLLALTEALIDAGQLDAAMNFAKRAVAEDAKSWEPLYLLGVILHKQDHHEEACQMLEEALKCKDVPEIRYSLGMLYCYYLNNKAQGLSHLQAALKLPTISLDLKSSITEELKRQSKQEEAPQK
ncbi:MAG: tetratricopeptide repeat protein [Desulfovibrionaceae bacterium]|nr:tetratricopeptide repeat protein [Desulfovibrionaceae bacterium]